ncbi:3-hydroxybutyryl-CoA dehydrogenase [Marinomonas sp. MED121]|uniref:3-hydroxybutyryl-CoA dehydrogenase n=1 Tax=Marinomonas sp. MED121 TaxID=314277 RepID=UPI0000690F87|nr:3-hydroxybutyryl-CoA dehydrogenase [Marinomonas sp. MED121]EAQ67726.1 3-hydroxybutyryl-CoA dehydrogenase [Marinomonas sp. MED121]
MNIQQIGVVGAGQMGSGIAQVCALAGYQVVMFDLNGEALEKALSGIAASLQRLIKKEKLTTEQMQSCLANISASTELNSIAEANLVIEAASEQENVKQSIFRQLDEICDPAAILATNTSSISITRLAAVTKRPSQVVGMHFMNPVPVMALVEVIRGLQTKDEVFDRVTLVSKVIGKTPVDVKDSPGFVANRILLPMINEGIFCLHEGLAKAEDIDEVMKLGMSHPMGPLALADLIGLDTCLSIMQVLYSSFNDPKYRPCPLLVQMVDAGYLGRKTGRGFYTY